MSSERDALLLAAVIVTLMGGPDENEFIYFDKFSNAMECYDYDYEQCYWIVEELAKKYNETR